MAVLKTVTSPGGIGAGQRRLRLFVGSDRAYSTFTSGFNAYDLTDPRSPTHIKQNTTGSQGWKQLIANGYPPACVDVILKYAANHLWKD